MYLHQLLAPGGSLHLRAPKQRSRAPDLMKRLEKMQGAEDERRYRAMVGGVVGRRGDDDDDWGVAAQLKGLKL